MVKKLFKHEFLSYARVMSIVYLILLTVATANRIIQFFEADTIVYSIINTFSWITYFISVIMVFIFAFWMNIVRFYRNLFSTEGYLTFTLPVTTTQHILVKAVTALVVGIVTVLVALISGCIVTAGELLVEIWKAIVFLIEEAFGNAGIQFVFIAIDIIVFLLVGAFASILLYDTCISIGQLSKKNRVLAAVGAYFVYYIARQIIGTIIVVIFTQLAMNGFIEKIAIWIGNHPYAATHIGFGTAILLSGVFAFVEFFVIRKIITNKLNLE